jgi:recombination protein RecT
MSTNNNTEVAKTEQTHTERFTNMVMKELGANGGSAVKLSQFQTRLIQNYFVKIDQTIKIADQKRLSKRDGDKETPIVWQNINMNKLALDVVAWAGLGLDPLQPNHINLIPYKNNAANNYDITGIIGYRGCELKATKYGLNHPDTIVIELVYSNDHFKQIKKDMNNQIESYEFVINDSFNRGEIVGGFYFYGYTKTPEKNRIRVFSLADILKRKPKYASTEFWGGEKDEWIDGKKTGQKVTMDGWREEMCYKTIARAAYNGITIDSQKIDENLARIMAREEDAFTEKMQAEITENANKEEITFAEHEDVTDQQVATQSIEATPEADATLQASVETATAQPQEKVTPSAVQQNELFTSQGPGY